MQGIVGRAWVSCKCINTTSIGRPWTKCFTTLSYELFHSVDCLIISEPCDNLQYLVALLTTSTHTVTYNFMWPWVVAVATYTFGCIWILLCFHLTSNIHTSICTWTREKRTSTSTAMGTHIWSKVKSTVCVNVLHVLYTIMYCMCKFYSTKY